MRQQLLLCVVLGSCGFQSSAGSDAAIVDRIDAPARDAAFDAASDAAFDAAPALSCWDHWRDHSIALQAPVLISGLSTTATERDPWISDDELRLYFWRQASTGTADVYLATRATIGDPFATAAKLDGLSLPDRDEGRVSLTHDELLLVVSSNLGGGSQFDVRLTSRANRTQMFPTPVPDRLTKVNTASTQHFDPFLSGDGLRLYLAPVPTGVQQHIAMASRTSVTADFTAAALLTVINTTEAGVGDSDPALSPDERVIVFTSNRSGGVGSGDLYYATRADAGQPFGAPVLMPTVNSTVADGDPILTKDGCTLYLSSVRGSGNFDLYTAAVIH